MDKVNNINKKTRRKIRIRSKVQGVSERPRLSVHRSSKYIYAQIINDEKGITLVGATEKDLTEKTKLNKTEKAKKLGEVIAKKAIAKKIKKVVFDRGDYAYHGRVKALADGAREGGLEF
jgi:large subunit ribosomal protein L18